jgi:hypothetical protein
MDNLVYFVSSSSLSSLLTVQGSGKSYTLLGSEKEVGILQKSIDYLLSTIASFAQVDKKSDYSIYLGAMCVLNETLYDQFDNDEIQIKYTKNGLLDFSLNLGIVIIIIEVSSLH